METFKIRDIFQPFIGKTIMDVTQHEDGAAQPFVQLMFNDTSWVRFYTAWFDAELLNGERHSFNCQENQ